MTISKHARQLVRARIAATGETYTQASAQVRAALTGIRLDDPLTVEVHGKHGQTVVFVPDGTQLLSGGQDARIAVTDPRTGEPAGEFLGHEKVVNAVAIDTRASVLVSVSSDRTVRTWDLAGQRQIAVLEGHKDAVISLALSPDGSQAVTGGYDGRLRRWDLEREECIDERRSQLKRIATLAVTPDGNHTLESGQGPLVVIRDPSGEPTAQLDTGAPGVIGLNVAPDGAIVATAGYDGAVGLWSCDTWELLRELPVGAQTNAIAFSRDGQLLAAAAAGRIAVWSHHEDDPIATYDPLKRASVPGVATWIEGDERGVSRRFELPTSSTPYPRLWRWRVSDAWPAWATQEIEISAPDPAWERRAAELCAGLARRLARWLDGHVEHVGSTAVPGLAAKPVIDLMAPVHSLVDSAHADDVLAEVGWHLVPPELDQRPWRRMYVLPEGDRRLAHLHFVEPTHPQWRDVLLFRDRLRSHPELTAEYVRIKRLAAKAHAADREAYTAAKSAFVHQVIRPDANRSAQRPIG